MNIIGLFYCIKILYDFYINIEGVPMKSVHFGTIKNAKPHKPFLKWEYIV